MKKPAIKKPVKKSNSTNFVQSDNQQWNYKIYEGTWTFDPVDKEISDIKEQIRSLKHVSSYLEGIKTAKSLPIQILSSPETLSNLAKDLENKLAHLEVKKSKK